VSKEGLVVWLTGLSGSGKTTICQAVAKELIRRKLPVEVLDGDDVRKNLTSDLGFTKTDRDDNVHRIGYVAHLLARNGIIVMVAVISPYYDTRQEVYKTLGKVIEVHVHAPLSVCEARDPKGLYAKVRAGELWNFTGIDDPYEPPLTPEIECNTAAETIDESRDKVIKAVLKSIR
jgi:adenylylsulfate kinase